MKKKIAWSLMTSLIFVLVLATSAFAKVPGKSIIIGNKAFDINLLFDNSNVSKINAALANANGIMYYNLDGGTTFNDIMTGQQVSDSAMSQLPQIDYTDANGNETTYGAGNGDPVVSNTANVTVKVGAISTFKQVTVNTTDVTGAVSFALKEATGSSYLNTPVAINQDCNVTTSQSTLQIFLLDANNQEIASGTIDVSTNNTSTIQLSTSQSGTTTGGFEVTSIS